MPDPTTVYVYFRADNGCHCTPQCGGYEIMHTYKDGNTSRQVARQWVNEDDAIVYAKEQGWVVRDA
jgi:hypothetical protein